MILIDHLGHMVATESEEELHIFARKIGLKRTWFQQPKNPSMRHAHYDLTTQRKINQAIANGAEQIGREILTRAWWSKEFQ